MTAMAKISSSITMTTSMVMTTITTITTAMAPASMAITTITAAADYGCGHNLLLANIKVRKGGKITSHNEAPYAARP